MKPAESRASDFKATWQYQMGRRGEILMMEVLRRFRYALFDIGGSTNNKAPFLHDATLTVAPDALSMGGPTVRRPLQIEMKTKMRSNRWRGGSVTMKEVVHPRWEQGIERRSYTEYLKGQLHANAPMVLMFLVISDGVLLAASLNMLGKPRVSPAGSGFDMVNWDVKAFHEIMRFDKRALRQYFVEDDEFGSGVWSATHRCIFRRAPPDIPTRGQLAAALHQLRATQSAFDFFYNDLIAELDVRWHGSETA